MPETNGEGKSDIPPGPESWGDLQGSPKSETVDGSIQQVLQRAGVDTGDPNVQRTLEVMRVTLARGSLPLPPPAILAEYAKVIPDLPERFVIWTETQSAHRRELERAKALGSETRMNRGQIGALILSVVGLCIAGAEGVYGSATVAGIIAVVSVGGPAAAVILANKASAPRSAQTGAPPDRVGKARKR